MSLILYQVDFCALCILRYILGRNTLINNSLQYPLKQTFKKNTMTDQGKLFLIITKV